MNGIAIVYLEQFAPIAFGVVFLATAMSINYRRGRLRITCESKTRPYASSESGKIVTYGVKSMPVHASELGSGNPIEAAYHAVGSGDGIVMWHGYIGRGEIRRGAFIRNAYDRLLSDGLLRGNPSDKAVAELAFASYGLIDAQELRKLAKYLKIRKAEKIEIFDLDDGLRLVEVIESYARLSGLLLAYAIDGRLSAWRGVFD
ncbi:MAG: hypothetical protein QW774_03230 [Candidatus Micrarchaeaceae archaeon]